MRTSNCFIFYVIIVVLLEYDHTTNFTSCSATTTHHHHHHVSLNITTDQSALLTFKSHIISDPNRILTTNWSISTQASCCSWVGVSCSSRHGRVMALDLSNMGLIGTIPPEIGNLSFLVSFDLTNNSFNGSLPKELSNLRRLKEIYFRNNSFGGELPSWWSKLPNLKDLFLSFNSFTGTIPPSLSNLSKLERLSLGRNPLQGNIPGDFGSFKNLQVLEFQSNQLSGSIPLTVFNISTLRNLALTNNSLSGNLPRDICHKIPKIQGLYLSYNQLSGPIPSSLHECSELQLMALSLNNFDGIIPREIGNLTLLQQLSLGDNHLKEYGSEGLVSTKCDVYSYGIMLMEVFIRTKPSDEQFLGDMSLKRWVNDSLPNLVIQVIDTNLLKPKDGHITVKLQCVSSIMELALSCVADSPEERSNMKDVMVTLKKIKLDFLANHERN